MKKVSTTAERLNTIMKERNLKQSDILEKCKPFCDKYGIKMKRAYTRITAVYANGLESELLNIDMKKPVMRYEGIVFDSEGRLIEYYDDILLKEKVEFFSNEVDV